MWKDRDRRRNLASYSRRNQCGLENGRNEVEALNSSESDERAGVRDDETQSFLSASSSRCNSSPSSWKYGMPCFEAYRMNSSRSIRSSCAALPLDTSPWR